MSDFVRRLALRSWTGLQSIWTMAGVTLVLLLLIEGTARVAQQLRAPVLPAPLARDDPRRALAWWPEFNREFDETRPQRWRPYVYYGVYPTYRGRYINIDSAGHRATPQRSAPGEPALRVLVLGGSTVWGTSQRDSATIPAELARRLQALVGDGTRVEVTNMGQSGYVTTQGVLEVILALRSGYRPDLVVAYEGINDVAATMQYGAPGFPQNESKRAEEFALGRSLDRTRYDRGFRHDMRALGRLGVEAFKQSAFVDWVKSLRPAAVPALLTVDSAAHGTARVYAENARVIEGLSKTYGFTAVHVWQPSLHATGKVPTAFEARLLRGIAADPFQRRMQEVYKAVPPLLDSVMPAIAPGRFVNAGALFAGDSQPVFVDRIGHNTEPVIPIIVDAFWPTVKAALAARRPSRTGA